MCLPDIIASSVHNDVSSGVISGDGCNYADSPYDAASEFIDIEGVSPINNASSAYHSYAFDVISADGSDDNTVYDAAVSSPIQQGVSTNSIIAME